MFEKSISHLVLSLGAEAGDEDEIGSEEEKDILKGIRDEIENKVLFMSLNEVLKTYLFLCLPLDFWTALRS